MKIGIIDLQNRDWFLSQIQASGSAEPGPRRTFVIGQLLQAVVDDSGPKAEADQTHRTFPLQRHDESVTR